MKKLIFISLILSLFIMAQAQRVVTIEKRAEVVTVTYNDYTLEFGVGCPPQCGVLESLGTVGKIIAAKEADELFGKPLLTTTVSLADAKKMIRLAEVYVLVGVPGKGNMAFASDKSYKFYSDGLTGEEPYIYIYSKSMLLELLSR